MPRRSRPARLLVLLGSLTLACSQPAVSPDVTQPAPDLRQDGDLSAPAMPPDLAPYPCFTSQSQDWQTPGDTYCQQRGALCIGVDYYGSSTDCSGEPYTGCWGSGEAACCSYKLADHAGTPSPPASGRWRCVAPGTPICGNGKIEGNEACDDGLRNGTACRPGLGGSCSYCSASCTRVQVAPASGDCITPSNSDWTVTGTAWCAARGKSCVGTAYFSGSLACAGSPHTACWGSSPKDCCATSMDDHAGFSPASARWQCQ